MKIETQGGMGAIVVLSLMVASAALTTLLVVLL